MPTTDIFQHDELAYCDLIAQVGRRNRGNLGWWASTVASKNFNAADLWHPVQRLMAGQPVDLPAVPSRSGLWKQALIQAYRRRLLVPAPVRRQWRQHRRAAAPGQLLIFTHWMRESFPDGTDYRDGYWQPLLEHLAGTGTPYTLIGQIVTDEPHVIESLRQRAGRFGAAFPLDTFLTDPDILRALRLTLASSLDCPDPLPFGERDLAPLLRHFFAMDLANGEIFRNLCRYLAIRRALRLLRPGRILWPWENHAWERLLMVAGRQAPERPRLIGYQHGALPPFLLNHFPGRGEAESAPFPDRILTVGGPTRRLLENSGRYPEGCLREACALRHQHLQDRPAPGWRGHGRPLGVALLAVKRESADLLRLAVRAWAGTGRQVLVRCHPQCPESTIRQIFPEPLPPGFSFEQAGPVTGFLARVGGVVCSESSLGLEAIAFGVPYIYADLGRGLTGDPFFDCPHLKWSASTPEDLRRAQAEIDAMTDAGFAAAWQAAYAYVQDYYLSCTPERLAVFLEA